MLLYGNGGHAKVLMDCLKDLNIPLNGIFDDNAISDNLNSNYFTSIYNQNIFIDDEVVISIGNNLLRKEISERIYHSFGIIIHPSAVVSSSVQIKSGTVVIHQSLIQRSTIIGHHVVLNSGCSVDHDCEISDYVHIGPHATVCGGIKIGEGTLVGAGAVIISNKTIGKWVTIGAGAVITENIPDYAVVVGNPSEIIRYNEP